ncbi:pentapeptide repeat-containing protein [Pseudomonas fluorescens]|uniref:Pentapeptide repeat-containing protein n=1 Tax=Pseudomonas fluorescens TaxID=294 RepID=A0A5E6VLI6_PSEFL|nr:pentapeptide repeat-containing protein [Pseudomonas fluorescens]VVN18777.1 hypothetical protein PS652_04211 [Pseudomonas fluorescens]
MDRELELSPVEIQSLRDRWYSTIGQEIIREMISQLREKRFEWVKSLSLLPPTSSTTPYPEILDDLRGLEMSRLDLRNVSLSFFDLSFSKFDHCNLKGISLQGSKLSHSEFKNSNLSNADMLQIMADNSAFIDCKFIKAMMRMGDYRASRFVECSLIGSILYDCNFSKAQFESVELYKAKTDGAIFPNGFNIKNHLRNQPRNDRGFP